MAREAVGFSGGLRRVLGAPRVRAICALGVGAVVLALFAASVPLQSAANMWAQDNTPTFPLGVACLAIGLLLATRRADNPMGWCLLATALFLALNIASSAYSVLDYRLHHALPLAGLAVLLQPSWAPGIVFIGLSFLIFPDGHFSSRAVKWVMWLVLGVGAVWIGGAFGMVVQALATHTVRVTSAGTLLTITHPTGSWAWWNPVQYAFFVVLALSWIVWIVQQVPRYRRAGDEERHQTKWLLSGAVVTLGCGLLTFVFLDDNGWATWIPIVGLVVLPVSIAIGVLKFHLYDIDRLVSRTLSYVLVTALVVGVYVGVVTLTTDGIGFSSPEGVAVSTLVAAALFNPLRKRLQRGVDRRFNRARYDAERTVSSFAARLRESVDPDAVGDDLLGVVHAVFEPSAATLWVRREAAG